MWQQASPTTTPEKEMAFVTRLTVLICDMKREGEGGSVVPDSLRLHGLYSPWNSSGQNTGVGSLSLLQASSQPRDEKPRSPALQADSYLSHTHTHKFLLTYVRKWAGSQVSWGQQESLWGLEFHFCGVELRTFNALCLG